MLTHGFVLDEKGQKMSKSLGNTVAPQDVIKNSGADILRLWVAASDYADDLRIGPEILKTFVETYRKMRNTLRWMLGTLAHYDPKQTVALNEMPELERLMLHRLAELDDIIRKAYAEYDYKRVVAVLSQFMNTDLSAFYFDVRKDALYCEPYSSMKRRAALEVIEQIFRCTTVWLAPLALLHGGGGMARALSVRDRLRASGAVSGPAGRMARRRARAEVADGPARAPRRHRCARDRAREQDDRVVAGGGTAGLCLGRRRDARRCEGVDLAEICITSGLELKSRRGAGEAPSRSTTWRASAWCRGRPKARSARARGASRRTWDRTRRSRICPRATRRPCANSTP